MEDISKDLGVDPPSKDEVTEVLNHLDTDKSGTVEFNEFVVLIKDVLTAMAEAQ